MRPAVWRFGTVLALAASASCWHGAPSPNTPPVANHVDTAAAVDPVGSYSCSIREDTFSYPPFPCTIAHTHAGFILSKLGGSVRFRGRIVPDAHHGFAFAGQMFCPEGDCTAALDGAFAESRRGELVGHFRNNPMVVTLVPAPPNAFGGAAYGGTDYGDDGCDDASCGGGGYGGAANADPFNARH